jgi:hypothetical protein
MAAQLGRMQLLPSLLIRDDDAGIAREGDMVGFQQAAGPRVLDSVGAVHTITEMPTVTATTSLDASVALPAGAPFRHVLAAKD